MHHIGILAAACDGEALPRADRMLTDRPYYWGFVERTGVDPETLSFSFVFDPQKYDELAAQAAAPAARPRGGASRPAGAGAPPGVAGAADAEAAAEPLGAAQAPELRCRPGYLLRRRTASSRGTSASFRRCRASDRA